MSKKEMSEEFRKKALEYRALNIEKYKQIIYELETRKATIIAEPFVVTRKGEIDLCEKLIKKAREDYENVSNQSKEIFVKVVSEPSLLLNVAKAFDAGKIEKREARVLSSEKIAEIIAKRQERKSAYRTMTIEELLDVVMDNERLEIEVLKKKIANNSKFFDEQSSEPSSR